MDIIEALEVSKQLAIKAGKVIMEIYKTDFDVAYKEDESPLTLADQSANDVIVKGLIEVFPQAGILSEESEAIKGIRDKEYCFIVDPLDGTKEFVKKNDEFTVNIGLAKEGIVIMGVIYVPVTEELYYGAKGYGAFLEKGGISEPIKVTDLEKDIRLVVSKSHMGDQEKALIEKYSDKIASTKQAGSSIKGCLVASGQAEVYYRYGNTCEWDTAAMQAICEAAGAIFRQMDGSLMRYNRENHLNEKGFYVINSKNNYLT